MSEHHPAVTRHSGAILAVILISYLMIIIDTSIVITGLPKIRAELSFTPSDLSWIQSIYTLAFGGFLLLGARAGDIIGRRKTFQIGLVVFSLASVAIGLAQSAGMMIAARAIQGMGAAILAPSTLALLSFSFPEGPERTRATAWYGSVAGIGAALGLVLGGILADWLSWRVGFFINLPIGALMLFLGSRYVEETETHKGRFDLIGAIASTIGFGLLTWGIVETSEQSLGSPIVLGALVVGLVIIGFFVLHEARTPQPIMPLRLFCDRERVGAYLARFFYLAAMVGFFFFMTQFLQGVLGFTAFQAGLGYLPMTLVNFAVATQVPRLVQRFGGKPLMFTGILLTSIGIYWLSRVGIGANYTLSVALPMVLIGAGQGFCFGPLTAAGVVRTEKRDAGAASGLVNVSHQMGMSCGLALLVSVSERAHHDGSDAIALAHGFEAAMTVGSLLVLVSLFAAVILMRSPRRRAGGGDLSAKTA